MIFDTHAHYDDEAFDDDRIQLLDSLPGRGVGAVVNSGSSLKACQNTVELMEKYPYVYGSLGVHPSDSGELTEETFSWLTQACRREKCVAVGETGLDYHWQEPGADLQKKWFARQLNLAEELKLPVVIHSRDAAKDTLDIMKAERAERIGGVMHCYAYSKEIARELLDMGFYFGIGGVLTFKNGKKLKEVVEFLPMEYIVLETDSPYLAPEPNRGKRNSSLNLPYVVKALAEIKKLPEEAVERITWENACRLYRLEK